VVVVIMEEDRERMGIDDSLSLELKMTPIIKAKCLRVYADLDDFLLCLYLCNCKRLTW